jgi:rubredoxin
VTAPDSIHCPKCGGRAKGPQYQPPTFPLYKDSLKYTCRCGYVQYEPTKDTTEDR